MRDPHRRPSCAWPRCVISSNGWSSARSCRPAAVELDRNLAGANAAIGNGKIQILRRRRSSGRSAATSAGAAATPMSSRRRLPPPKRERADPMAESGPMRTETFPVGIVGVGLAEETQQVPIGEPPPLPPNAELAVIGKPYPRANGRAKVTGAIRFTVDVAPQGMLFARILRSPNAHAEVRAIDTAAAERDPRVRAIVRAVALRDPVHSIVRY